MSLELTNMATDPEKELNGVWCPYKDGSRLLIARLGNPKYRSRLRVKVKSKRAILDNEDDLADKVGDTVFGEVMAETILLDWEGIKINGQEIKYTTELGKQLLTDPSNRDFREDVKKFAETEEIYRRKIEDEAVGN